MAQKHYGKRQKLTEEDYAAIVVMRDRGLAWETIASRKGISTEYTRQIYRTKKEGGQR
jgi:hypothetical protein